MKVREAARRLNVSEKTIYKWLREGLLPANRVGKTWIITEESIAGLLSPTGVEAGTADSTNSTARQRTRWTNSPVTTTNNSTDRRYSLPEAFAELGSITAGAVTNGISGILGPRRVDPNTPRAVASVLESAEGEVLLQGVGLREFFGDKDHAEILRSMASEDRPVSVRAILVDPTGQFARARTVVQDGEQFADDALFRAGPLFGDSWRSLNVIAALRKASQAASQFRLDVRFADHWPSTYLVLTSKAAFVEPYHFGKTGGALDGGTIDGLVPMFKIAPGFSYYELLRDHFDYLWSGSNPFISMQTLDEVAESVKVQL